MFANARMPTAKASTRATPVEQSQNAKAHLWATGALLLGFALRLFRLGGESLWYDETVSVYLASQSTAELIAHTARDIHPPGYYLLLALWRQIAAPTREFGLEFLYAWPSLFFDILVMALTYAITKRVFGRRAAAWAIALSILHPTQVWFAQEVRMYSLGAFLLMLTLWSVAPFFADKREETHVSLPRRTLLYPFAALLGLYTLYYFAFWLVVLVLAVTLRLWQNGPALRRWFMLQLVILIGWLPWLPTFYRQSLSPPVPAWRVPWQSAQDVLRSLQEAIAAIWIGHVPPLNLLWPWAAAVLAVALVYFVYAKSPSSVKGFWLLLAFGPLAMMFLVSLVGPPVYHVRYVDTYEPIFIVLVSALLARLRLYVAAPLLIAYTVVSALSLQAMWTQPHYAADDHRSAVAMLAEQWRPGDAILVNAGWAYTALAVYWPAELPSPSSARPPAIHRFARLTLDAVDRAALYDLLFSFTAPVVYRTGSVDGDPNLGWGLPESDFFTISAEETTAALTQLAAQYPRVWHYRIYDTVSDPNATIRQWLEETTTLEFQQPIPGRDFLLLERYRTAAPPVMQNTAAPAIRIAGTTVQLLGYDFTQEIAAGETLYTGLTWDFSPVIENEAVPPIALSLRLYDQQGTMLAQQDSALLTGSGSPSTQILALPIPAGTPPDSCQIRLVIYSPDNLEPFEALDANNAPLESPIHLGDITLQPRR
jgi:hypothetical protein